MLEEAVERFPDGGETAGGDRCGGLLSKGLGEASVFEEVGDGGCEGLGMSGNDPAGTAIGDEILDSRDGRCNHRSSAALSLRDRPVTMVGAGRREQDDIHGGVELGQGLVLVTGPMDAAVKAKLAGEVLELSLGLTMADHDDMDWRLDSSRRLEETVEASARSKLADHADDRRRRWDSEPGSPRCPVMLRMEAVLERHREGQRGSRVSGASRCHGGRREEEGMGASGHGAVQGIGAQVPGVSHVLDEQHAPVGASKNAHQMVVGKVTDHDVGVAARLAETSEVGDEVAGMALLDETGQGPLEPGQAPLEVPATNEQQ
jgi:hypothetical protein